jgi:hypothetical protein
VLENGKRGQANASDVEQITFQIEKKWKRQPKTQEKECVP